ncbi:DNA repair protein RecN [Levilactobacillus acidifarinae]|uniref:DNA repair protein RecN n=1 Tax=Levilactobacillus acidifarinae DSM 19394 = JCM 15949 TaxID=1423715 RepID=A0A0R1LEU3_9LACO|nr:DNA repair protein RecN [Levilactobacillus acidifarinae]KRK94350.1 DNA repair ATPase [Levilactobacillus acidifarinae DSM 19394]GEO69995.1 DNA repair protein RecN [Levilactobacillus acidifarinae]
MLQELSIKNFAIIDHLDVTFKNGMTVLTGETGAGKSIIIDAVGLLAGGRGSASFVRTGTSKAVIQGSFVFPKNGVTYHVLDDLGIDHEDGSVILQREIHANGRNVCRVNGMLVNTSTLKRIGETAVDIHGQNEHQELMQPDKHLGMLDEFAGTKVAQLRQKYQDLYRAYKKLKATLENRRANEKEWAQHLDMLKFQVSEIEDAQLQEGEEEALIAERDRLDNFQKINDALQRTQVILTGEDTVPGANDQIGSAMQAMQGIADFAPDFKEIATSLENAYYTLSDAVGDVSSQLDSLEWDEGRLDEIERRLEVINQLKYKYGDSEAQVLKYYDQIAAELKQMEATDETADDLEDRVSAQETQLQALGDQLSTARQAAAKHLETAIHHELADLYMAKTVFAVHFERPTGHPLLSSGVDQVEFYLRTNPGEAMRPLAKIASGGELSRIMLALKTIFSESQGVTSIIFDEVDTGVSGRVAQAIAEKISGIAQNSQVLCITHLPQVAAMADHHFFIAKQIVGDRTETKLTRLSATKRIDELARMSAGTQVTKLAVEHAHELLTLADEVKAKRQSIK